MTVLDIVTVGDPVLRERARELSTEELRSDEVQRLIDDMIETKRAAHGAGIAANQVGRALRVAVVEVQPGNPRYPYKPPVDLTVIVNPEIEPVDDELFAVNEGCLSVPGLWAPTVRAQHAVVEGFDVDGKPLRLEGDGLMARCLQHEVDHLDGTVFLDRLTGEARKNALRALRSR